MLGTWYEHPYVVWIWIILEAYTTRPFRVQQMSKESFFHFAPITKQFTFDDKHSPFFLQNRIFTVQLTTHFHLFSYSETLFSEYRSLKLLKLPQPLGKKTTTRVPMHSEPPK